MKRSSIYVIAEADGTQCKIGISHDPLTRCRQLQTGHPKPLMVHYSDEMDEDRAKVIEKFIHNQNGHLRAKGEWFTMTIEQAITEVKFSILRWGDDPNLIVIFRHKLKKF